MFALAKCTLITIPKPKNKKIKVYYLFASAALFTKFDMLYVIELNLLEDFTPIQNLHYYLIKRPYFLREFCLRGHPVFCSTSYILLHALPFYIQVVLDGNTCTI